MTEKNKTHTQRNEHISRKQAAEAASKMRSAGSKQERQEAASKLASYRHETGQGRGHDDHNRNK